MYLGTQLRPGFMRPQRSRRWAVLLCWGYALNLLMELSMLRFTVGADGHFLVKTATELDTWTTVFVLVVGAYSLVCSIGFLISFFRERRFDHFQHYSRNVTGTDFLYVIAWLQILSTFLLAGYALFFSYPVFPEGSIGGIIESASIQFMILMVSAIWFRGRWQAIGFTCPKHPVRMLIAIVVILAFVILVLDFLLTNPIADWLKLSLQSERELEIQNGIMQAKASNWLNGVVSVAVVGIFVPIAEEILFRGVIQTYLVSRFGAFIGILATSFWFALMHVDIALFVPLFVIGVGLGFVRHRYQTIWGAIILHSLNNLASAMQYFT